MALLRDTAEDDLDNHLFAIAYGPALDYARAALAYSRALAEARSVEERMVVFEAMVHFHANCGDFRAAYDTGRKAAAELWGACPPASRRRRPGLDRRGGPGALPRQASGQEPLRAGFGGLGTA
ncbi:hypothetical protein [Magnetospirillum sp. UT-4]|uniref:hypothetical protein n=1 Tax=Magnetospirillum sp. UT-4 TaxID=2681467 RepID=UPI00138268EE|nr:hypothetical protein [Magnetospirillum sp. UT-4]CAA7619652.1 hypothetical protein MTBUT4_310032 [Magnetospirillum sp. UT-4]